MAPFATSNESIFADFGNFGDTRPAGSNIKTKIIIFLKMIHLRLNKTRHRHAMFFIK